MQEGNRTVYALLVVFLVLTFCSVWLFLSSPRLIQTEEFDVSFIVEENSKIGFDVSTELLSFGRITPGGAGTRKINIENSYDFPIKTKATISGKISEVVHADETIIQPGESGLVVVTLSVPENFVDGNYTSSLKLELYKD